MIAEIISNNVKTKINWSKPQWVISLAGDVIVMTSGIHAEDKFSGICLPSKGRSFSQSDSWSKELFKLIPTEGIELLIKNS